MLSHRTADLLTKLDAVNSFDALWSATDDYLQQVGATHSIYTFVDQDEPARTRAWTSLPQSWCTLYLDEGYREIDPFYRYCCRSFAAVGTGPEYLTDHDFLSAPERRVVLEGGDTGFRSGFSSPVKLTGGSSFGGWNFGSGLKRSAFEKWLKANGSDLRLAGFFIHEHAEQLARRCQNATPKVVLSARERECLLWLSRGLRNAEIAHRLGIAVVTVDLYMKNARRKLNAATREEALAKSILQKLIAP